jgi:hypothetical protein
VAKFFDRVREVVTKAGQSQFANNPAKRSLPTALIPGQRQLSLGEILAPGGTEQIRDISSSYWFGPLQPIKPTAPDSYRPRQFQYLPGSNILWTPKSDSAITFETLRTLADSWDLLRIVIETQKDRICKTKFVARKKMTVDYATKTDWEKDNAKDKTVKALNDVFLASPDGFHDFDTWLRMWLEDMIVCDAVALWLERDQQGRIASVHPLDGSTINRLLTDQGLTPPPPSAAYQQVVYGTPACDLTTDELLYFMRNERTNRRYGYSPVEQCMLSIVIGLNNQEFWAQYYKSGNVPEALCFLPGDLPADKVKEYQDFFDSALAGDLSKRRRLTFLPGFGTDGKGQSSVQFTKDNLTKDETYELLIRIVCFCIGVNAQPLMKTLAPRAGAQVQQETSEEEGKEPYIQSVLTVLNNLIQRKMGLAEYEVIREEDQELDPLKAAQADNLLAGKIMKVNEIRKKRGLDPDDSVEADQLGAYSTMAGFIPLSAEDQLARQKTLGTDPDSIHQRSMDAAAAQPTPVVAGGKSNGKAKDSKGKPNGKASGVDKAARFSHGSLPQIHAGVLSHASQDAKTQMQGDLQRTFGKMRTAVINHIHDAIGEHKQLAAADLPQFTKAEINTLEAFEHDTHGKTRYSVNHVFDNAIELRPRRHRPYGKKSEIKEATLKLSDLVPTQYFVKPSKVLFYVENPTDRPVHVVDLDGTYLLSDGHHRAVARRLSGGTEIDAILFPRWATDEEIEANKHKKGMRVGELAKAEEDYSEIVNDIMEALSVNFDTLASEIEPMLRQAAASGLTQGILSVDVNDADLLSDVNSTAQGWATDRAAELVGRKWDDEGHLIENPNAEWAITDLTREKIRAAVEEAFGEQSDVTEIAQAIDDSGIFSPARSEMIARTEISRAQVMGNFTLWEKSGLIKNVTWLLGDDPCEVCTDLEANSPYAIGDCPKPIDDSHPNCMCVLSAIVN